MDDEEIMTHAIRALDKVRHLGAREMDGGLIEIDVALLALSWRLVGFLSDEKQDGEQEESKK